ncbi:MAG: AsmA family protein [Steroidobacteraceae bacterium]
MKMRGLRVLGYVLGGFILLGALLLLAVALFVNPNDYKGRIAREVKASTGRDLVLQGDIKLSVFPWIALNLGPVSLGNPEGFGTDPFLSVQRTALRVKLLPLLQKKLEVGRIEIDGLDLRLKTNAAGKGNWEDFGQKKATATSGSGQGSESLQSLDGIQVKNSRVSYDTLTLSNLNLDVGKVSRHSTVPVQAGFDLNTGPGGNDLSFTAALDVTLDSAARRYGLEGVKLGGDLKLKTARDKLPWKFLAPAVEVDLAAQTLKAPAFSAQVGAARLSGSLSGEKIIDAPAIGGSFKLDPLMLRGFLTQLGIQLPKTQDATVLSKLTASSDFSYALKAVHLEKLAMQLDETQLRGAVAVTNLDTQAMSFDLNVDHIDLDRYLAPKRPAQAAATAPAAPTPLPTAAVRALNINGNFSVGSARIKGFALSNLRLSVRAADGIVHLFPIKASLYGGTYSGDLTYDAHDEVPKLRVDQEITGVEMAPLLKDGIKSERLSGRGNASTKLASFGPTSDALIKNLSGRVAMNLADGAVNGIDLWYELNRAQALLKQQSLPAGSDDRRTKFDSFRMSADIVGGVATTRDLNVASQYLRVTGGGTTNLLTEAIDYHIVAVVLKTPPASQGADLSQLTLAGIPVDIRGTASDPKVRPDLQGLLKSKLKQKLQDTLQNKLRGLLGK